MEDSGTSYKKRAKKYAKLKYWLILINLVYVFTFMIVIMISGASTSLADLAERFAGPGLAARAAYLAGFVTITTIFLLPLNFFSGYIVEHRFDLSNQTMSGWLADEIKGFAVSLLIFTPMGLTAYWLLAKTQTYWWLLAAFAYSAFSFVLAYLAPIIIMPLFNKFEALDSEPLKTEILNLARKADVSITDVLRTDMSKRTKKANAFFAGVGNTKRIALGDTLLENYTDQEILTVVGHEMGHWKLGHLWKNTVFAISSSLVGFYLANLFLKTGLDYFALRGIDDIAGLPVIILAFLLLGVFSMPITNALSRHFEIEADIFELKLVSQPQATISTFEKLAEQNLADPSPPAIIEFLLYSHPSPRKRIILATKYLK